jgi:hypothetical protein
MTQNAMYTENIRKYEHYYKPEKTQVIRNGMKIVFQ